MVLKPTPVPTSPSFLVEYGRQISDQCAETTATKWIHNECLGNTTPVYIELSERGDPWYSQIASHVTSAQLSIASHWIVHPNQITCSLNREFRHHQFPLLHWRQIPKEQLMKAMVTHTLLIRPDVGNPPSPPTTKSFGDSCQPICYRTFSHSSKDNSHYSRADHPVP